eukprot:UN01108
MVTREDEPPRALIIACSLLWGSILCSITFCAAIFAFRDESDKCKINDAVVSPKTYFLAAFIWLMICHSISILNTKQACVFRKCMDSDTRENCSQLVAFMYMICLGIFGLLWGIIGFIVYAKLGSQCQKESIGKMLLAYDIISMIWAPFFCIVGIVQMKKKNHLQWRVFQHFDTINFFYAPA